ncbi:hypothetical protein GQS52_18050 [Streptomyces sp. SCUT-3]|uniref:hypothetical protein n=1 Tax=Streptomyces sp. SCUT-3 TaxID=2684469 RepID=UPI0015FB0468|nr:hypothetical protein [Streptomyces sp. SCUT-3]QMV23352.1 hypothetical protein GQS52_18050 [Streptomyces sp. SCUT-3]
MHFPAGPRDRAAGSPVGRTTDWQLPALLKPCGLSSKGSHGPAPSTDMQKGAPSAWQLPGAPS